MYSVVNLQWAWWSNLPIKIWILALKKLHIKTKLFIQNLKIKSIFQTFHKLDYSKEMMKMKIRIVKKIFKLSVILWNS